MYSPSSPPPNAAGLHLIRVQMCQAVWFSQISYLCLSYITDADVCIQILCEEKKSAKQVFLKPRANEKRTFQVYSIRRFLWEIMVKLLS